MRNTSNCSKLMWSTDFAFFVGYSRWWWCSQHPLFVHKNKPVHRYNFFSSMKGKKWKDISFTESYNKNKDLNLIGRNLNMNKKIKIICNFETQLVKVYFFSSNYKLILYSQYIDLDLDTHISILKSESNGGKKTFQSMKWNETPKW